MQDDEWFEPMPQTGHQMACCDCRLIHKIDFRIVDGKVQLKARRLNRSTAQSRRHHGVSISRSK